MSPLLRNECASIADAENASEQRRQTVKSRRSFIAKTPLKEKYGSATDKRSEERFFFLRFKFEAQKFEEANSESEVCVCFEHRFLFLSSLMSISKLFKEKSSW